MTNTNKVYIYVGNESGYTNGNWYYYNGSRWVSGGVYNSQAINTDATLTHQGVAADAEAAGKIVEISETQPAAPANRVWIPETQESTVQIPTWAEHQALNGALNAMENGIAIIVNGDTCATAVPPGGYAYIKNNTHGLAEGLYRNKSNSAFPTSGGTANSTVFESASIGANMLSSGDFVNELSVEIDGIGIDAGSYADIDTQFSPYTDYKPVKNGYKAIAITGFTLTNAYTSGANAVLCNVFTYRMNTSENIYFRIRNNATTTARIRLRIYILWVKIK